MPCTPISYQIRRTFILMAAGGKLSMPFGLAILGCWPSVSWDSVCVKWGNKGNFSLANLQILLLASFPYQALPLRSLHTFQLYLSELWQEQTGSFRMQSSEVTYHSQFLEKELNKAITLGLGSTWLDTKFHDKELNLSCSLSVFST